MTFDDRKYDFQGDCDYTLVRDCGNSSDYHLWSNNERLRPSDRVSYLREVVLELGGTTYSVMKGFHVRVNGIDVSEHLPYLDDQVWIYRDVTSMVCNNALFFGSFKSCTMDVFVSSVSISIFLLFFTWK